MAANNESEERRNKILRARYGLLKLNCKSRGSPLFVVGQTMASRNSVDASQTQYFNQIRKKQALAGLRRTPLGVTISTMDDFRLVASGIQLPHYNQGSNDNYYHKTHQTSFNSKALIYKDVNQQQLLKEGQQLQQQDINSQHQQYRLHENFPYCMPPKGKFLEDLLDKAQAAEQRRRSAPSPTVMKAPQSSPTLYRENRESFLKHEDASNDPIVYSKSTSVQDGTKKDKSCMRGIVVIPSAEDIFENDNKQPKLSISGGDVGTQHTRPSQHEFKFHVEKNYESSYTKSLERQKSSTEVYKAYERSSTTSTAGTQENQPYNNYRSRSMQRRSTSPQVDKEMTTKRNRASTPQKNTSSPRNKVVLRKAGAGKSCPNLDSENSKATTTFDKTHRLSKTSSRNKMKKGTKNKQTTADINKQAEKTKAKMITVRQALPMKPSQSDIQELEMANTRRFLSMPKSRPKAVCFDVEGVDITHIDVKRAVEAILPDAYVTGVVTNVQFENTNVKLGTSGCKNRWIIELKDFMTRNKLIKNGLSLNCFVNNKVRERDGTFKRILQRKNVDIKLYDMTSMEEYKLYLRRNACEEKLQSAILMSAGRHGQLLTNML